ncbi:GAF domain-containing protein [Robiginitomaculum antarcticum]|uniref:GAF domain-containing protein n=1 Tax=Robiginitomaculum antarcticum TaxID=437507 RepID=UPI00036B758D|nr:GAF domain-containing protein [Robiginitomaculum antarcticum]
MDEFCRLSALDKTNLLDTAAELRFDRLTRLAATVLKTEIALVSLIDKDRQWFKSKHGLDTSETPRSQAFCSHAIKHSDIMVVNDASLDPRFVDNPLVTGDPKIRFYAGAPLITKNGYALGTLCIIDSKPRSDFGPEQQQILTDIAISVMTEIEAVTQERIIDDLTVVNEELKHRMGNMYAHVSSLISLMNRSVDGQKEFAQRLRERITTLAQTQALLANNHYTSAPINEIIETTLAPFQVEGSDKRINIQSADNFDVSPRGAFTLTLMINELATNAVKHGALSAPDGAIDISWSNGQKFDFEWREAVTGLSFKKDPGIGFGSQILRRIVPLEFKGEVDYDLAPTGLVYKFSGDPLRIRQIA